MRPPTAEHIAGYALSGKVVPRRGLAQVESDETGRFSVNHARLSLQVWAVYTLLVGGILLLAPNFLLGVFQIDDTSESWVRVVGVVVLVLTVLYGFIAKEPTRSLLKATVYARILAAVALLTIAFTAGPWQLALFGAADAAGASWTYFALMAESSATSV